MHRTTMTRGRRCRRAALPALLGALAAALLVAPAALAAAADFTGGTAVGDCPTYVPNDHTVNALRFSAAAGTLLDKNGVPVTTAGASYYLKLRISPTPAPAGSDNRGFIWNPATQSWVQERSGWAAFPVVTTGAGGAIEAADTWWYFKFGDVTKSGTYYLMLSLQPVDGGSGTTQNSSLKPAVTIVDMSGSLAAATAGYWAHDFTPTAFAGKRVEADVAGGSTVVALSRSVGSSPPTAPVPPDGTGGRNGDFRLGVPVGLSVDVKVQSVSWPAIGGSRSDVDIALGASDTTPPSAPGTLGVSAGGTSAALTWGAATDGTGVTAYTVYRWVDPENGAGYTAEPVAVHSATGAETSWTDTSLAQGTAYHYFVRASDAATNVGPRSNTVDVSPQVASAVTLQTSAAVVAWSRPAMLSGSLTGPAALAGKQVRIEASVAGGDWGQVATATTGADGSFSAAAIPEQATVYRAVFSGDAEHGAATSGEVTVTPKVRLGTPVAPSSMKKGKSYTVSGALTPQQPAGPSSVSIQCYLRVGRKWVLKKTFGATNADRGTATRYAAGVKLTVKGSWRLVAFSAETAAFAATTSGAKLVTVK